MASLTPDFEKLLRWAMRLSAFVSLMEFVSRPTPDPRRAVPVQVRAGVFERDDHACRYCGADSDLSIDHVIPVSRGGSNDPENLVAACLPCNLQKGARTPREAGMALHPPSGAP